MICCYRIKFVYSNIIKHEHFVPIFIIKKKMFKNKYSTLPLLLAIIGICWRFIAIIWLSDIMIIFFFKLYFTLPVHIYTLTPIYSNFIELIPTFLFSWFVGPYLDKYQNTSIVLMFLNIIGFIFIMAVNIVNTHFYSESK